MRVLYADRPLTVAAQRTTLLLDRGGGVRIDARVPLSCGLFDHVCVGSELLRRLSRREVGYCLKVGGKLVVFGFDRVQVVDPIDAKLLCIHRPPIDTRPLHVCSVMGRGIGVQHRRTVIYREARRLIVKDAVLLRRRQKHEVWLHWNVDADVWDMAAPEAGVITFHGSKGGKTVELTIKGPNSMHARVRSGYDDGTEVDGWVSRRYAERTRVASLTVALMTAVPIELTTEAVVL